MEGKKYIYIFSNNERPNLLKIGRTDRLPALRAEQLSRQTGAIGKYKEEWSLEVPDSELAEKIIHFKLKEFHYQKEFFKTDIKTAIAIIEETLFPFFKLEKNDDTSSEEDLDKRINALKLALKFASTKIEKEKILNLIRKNEIKLFRLKLK